MKYLGETSLKKLISLIKADLALKVDKVNGKGLSTNDYTNSEKDKLAGIATGANKTTVDSSLSSTSTNPVQNKVINGALSGKANSSHTHNASDITGTLELDHGGTGSNKSLKEAPNGAVIRKLKSDDYNELLYTPTKNGALYATSENGIPTFGTLPLAQGGTGSTSGLVNAPRNAIVRKAGDADDYLYYTPTKNGALYASQENGSPVFGTLPIAQGGTGATTAAKARENLGAAASSHTHSYLPLSGGTLTGDVTGKYFKGTWLQTTSATDLGATPPNIAVLDKDGRIYKRTPAEILSDTVGKTTLTFSQTSNAYLKNFSYTAFALTGLRIGFIRIYGKTNKALTIDTNYVLTGIPTGYGPDSMCSLAVHSSKDITAWMGGDGVHIRARDAVGVGYDIVICGIWFY